MNIQWEEENNEISSFFLFQNFFMEKFAKNINLSFFNPLDKVITKFSQMQKSCFN